MNSIKDIDVLCVGVTSYDLIFSVAHHPHEDEKSSANALLSCGGGPAANAAVTVAKLGLKAAFCGYLANDIFGDLHFKELQSAHVNTDLLIRGNKPGPLSVVLVKPNGERSLINYRAAKSLSSAQINVSQIYPKVILFDGHEAEISINFLTFAEKNHIPTILDAGSVNQGTSLLYNKVNYLVCSKAFALEMSQENNADLALQKLSKKNKNVVITLGSKGIIWKSSKGTGRLAAFNIDTVDTTGAGDIFHGAFARCVALNENWQQMMYFSTAAAALSCTKLGARTSIPTLKEVDTFLRKQGV